MVVEKIVNNKKIKIVTGSSQEQFLSDSDKEMDERARQAIRAAIKKAEVCKKPIAKYDLESKRAYLEYPNGMIEYVN